MNIALTWIGGLAATVALVYINKPVWAGVILALTCIVVLMLAGQGKQKPATLTELSTDFKTQGVKH